MRSCIQTPFTYLLFFFFVRKTSDMSVAHSCILDQLSRTSCRSLRVPGATFSNRRTSKTIEAKRKKLKKNKRWTAAIRYVHHLYNRHEWKKRAKGKKKRKNSRKKTAEGKKLSLSVSLRNVQTSKVSPQNLSRPSSCITILSFSFTLSLFPFLANTSREDQERTRRLARTHSISIHTSEDSTREYTR